MAMVTPVVVNYLDMTMGCNPSEDMPDNLRDHIIKSYQKEQVAVLVSDISGFTKLTRKYGIIHFSSIIARLRQITLPIMHEYGAILITTEGDSFNVIFSNAKSALLAAVAMKRVTAEYNSSLPEERRHFTLTLDGIGVDFGIGPILDKAGKLHGPTFHNAHILGEECCSKGQIAVSQKVVKALENTPEIPKSGFKSMAVEDFDDDHAREAFEAMGSIFEFIMPSQDKIVIPSVDDGSRLHQSLLQFAQRHGPGKTDEELSLLDSSIRERHMKRKVALMFDFKFVNDPPPDMELKLKYECLAKFDGVFRCYDVLQAEDVLYFFDNPVDAVLVALACNRVVERETMKKSSKSEASMTISGYGIHIGDVLYVDGTDIHWGDPVNTSSKLGQDIAENGDIFLTEEAYDVCKSDPRLSGCSFEQKEFTISGVQLRPWKVTSSQMLSAMAKAGPKLQRQDRELMKELVLADFSRCNGVRNNAIDRHNFVKLIKSLTRNIKDDDINLALAESSSPGTASISLETFFDSALSSLDRRT